MPDHVRFSKGNVQRSTGKKNKTLITKRDMNQSNLNWSSCSERGIILSLIFFESKQRNPKTREGRKRTAERKGEGKKKKPYLCQNGSELRRMNGAGFG